MSVQLTAILTCRNAEATLARCLTHLAWHGARIIVIDNGSTDKSVEIVRAAGDAIEELREDPFTGVFDLTHQLRIKREIISAVGTGWILHADADEFLDTPDGTPLVEYLTLWEESDALALPCAEVMFLPTSEKDRHDPDSFEDTMQACLRIEDRDPKQRVFRATAPLQRWMATAGHTVTGPTDAVPPASLSLRHYFGLSLDQIRADYLGRVYAPENLAKWWHGDRRADQMKIVPPDPVLLHNPDTLDGTPGTRRVPVFQPLPTETTPPPEALCDLEVFTTSLATLDQIATLASEMFPGLRTASAPPGHQTSGRPRLLITEHPMLDCPKGDAAVAHGEAWLRGVARARQIGISDDSPYAELRLEDLEDLVGLMQHTVRQLLSGGSMLPHLTEATPLRTHPDYCGRIRAITGGLATDLGYG